MVAGLDQLRKDVLENGQRDVEVSFGVVRLRRMTQKQVMQIRDFLPEKEGEEMSDESVVGLGLEVVAITAVDDDGNPCFDSDEGRKLLSQLSPSDANTLTQEAVSLNGLAGDNEESKKK